MTDTIEQQATTEIATVASLRRGDRFRVLGERRWATVEHQTALAVSGRTDGDWMLYLDEHGTIQVEVQRGTYAPPAGTVRVTAYTFDRSRLYTEGGPWAWFADYDLRPDATEADIINANVPYAWVSDVAQVLAVEGPAHLNGMRHRLDKPDASA